MATEAQANVRKKTVHQLNTPYSEVAWPEISQEDQDAILELLCSLISPIGQHRRTHVKPSKGKKAAKKAKKRGDEAPTGTASDDVPPVPELAHHVDVGLSSITRNMEAQGPQSSHQDLKPDPDRQYSMIFVARGDQSSTFNCHFPKMVGAASKDRALGDHISLVGFSRPSSERLSGCLGVPRVSSIAVSKTAPGSAALLKMVRDCAKPIEMRWMEGTQDLQYVPTKINAIETTVGPRRPKMSDPIPSK